MSANAFSRGLSIKKEIGDRKGERYHCTTSDLAETRGNLEEAKRLYRESLSICRDIGFREGEINSLNNLEKIGADEDDGDSN